MRTEDHRRAEDRRGLRYLSDLTDPDWKLVEPHIVPANTAALAGQADNLIALHNIAPLSDVE